MANMTKPQLEEALAEAQEKNQALEAKLEALMNDPEAVGQEAADKIKQLEADKEAAEDKAVAAEEVAKKTLEKLSDSEDSAATPEYHQAKAQALNEDGKPEGGAVKVRFPKKIRFEHKGKKYTGDDLKKDSSLLNKLFTAKVGFIEVVEPEKKED